MKLLLLAFVFVFSTAIYAQETKPKLEKEGKLTKVTYFHDNGEVAQVGYLLKGKAHGEWKAYNLEGIKISEGNYQKGTKEGKWFFWKNDQLTEVDYKNNKIVSAKTWSNADGVVFN